MEKRKFSRDIVIITASMECIDDQFKVFIKIDDWYFLYYLHTHHIVILNINKQCFEIAINRSTEISTDKSDCKSQCS